MAAVFTLLATAVAGVGASPAAAQGLAEVSISDISVTELNGSPPLAYKNALVTFSVTGPRNGSVSVVYNTFDTGSATADVDYRDFSQTVSISAGQSSVTRAIRVYGDTIPEPTETFEVRLSNPSNVTIGNSTAVVTINDNDGYVPPAGPAVSVADASVTEGDGPGTVTVALTLSEASATPVTVDLATADGSATDVNDYLAVNGTITFPANQTSASQTISIVGDTDFEPTETFTVVLSNPSANATIADGTATVTINDNDPVPPGVPDLSVSDEPVGEGDGTVTVTITADETSATPVTFDLATSDGSATAGADYTAVTTGVTLPANTLSVTQTITILEDTVSEPAETFNVDITNVVGGTIVDGSGVVTINDNDAPACSDGPYVTIGDITVTESEGQKNVLVTFTRSYAAPSNQTTRFFVDTIDGTAIAGQDYIDRQDQLVVIKTGLTKTLAYKILGDTTAEPTEMFQLRAENPLRACIDPNNDTGTITIIDNDGPPTPTVSVSDASTTETDTSSSVDVTVSLSATSLAPVTVELSTADGSATGTNDYVPAAATTVTIPAGALTATVPIGIVGDVDFEPTETFSVTLANPSGAILGTSTGTITILDNDPAPPAVSVGDASTTETDGASTVDATVSVDQQSASPITVLLSTADATATAGADYVAITQQLVTIPANTSSVVVPLSIVGDDDFEPTENFTVSITNPTGGAIIGDGAATITILDDEDPPPPVPVISVADANTTETDGPSSVDVVVTLDQATTNSVTVEVSTADGSADSGDYTAIGPSTVTFAPGDTSETVSIPIIGDDVVESTEDFTVSLANPVNGSIGDGTGVVTISDDDAPACTSDPQITIDDLTVTEANFETNAIVTFRRSYSTNLSTRFYINTIDGTAAAPGDYTARTNQLIVINGGQTTKTLAFKIQGDSLGEPTESFDIQAFNPTRGCIDPNNDIGTVTILDDDGLPVPNVSVSDVTTVETDATSSVGVTVALDQVSLNNVTVQLTTADGTATNSNDYINPGPLTVTIPAGDLSTSVPIAIVGDDVYEQTEDFTVNLSSPVNANIGTGTATVTINDDEPVPPSVSIAGASTTETDTNSTVDVTVSLDNQSTNPVTVLLSTTNGSATEPDDYIAVAGQLVTIPANTSSVTVPLTIVGDEIFEQTETFDVSLSGPTNAILGTSTATVTIDDDEVPPPNVSVADASTNEGDTNTTVDVVVSLDATTSAPATVLLTTSDGTAEAGSDYVAASSQLVTIPANTLSVNVPITIIGDLVYEQSETFSISLSSPTNAFIGDGLATIGITDNDPVPPGLTIADISTTETDANFTVDVTVSLDSPSPTPVTVELSTNDDTAVAVDDFLAITDLLVTIPANTSSVTVPLTIVGDTVFEQTETFTVTMANPTGAIIGDGEATVTVADNDPIPTPTPDITIADVTTTEGDGPTTVDLTITLSEPTGNTVTVDVTTVDGTALAGSDYTASGPTTVTFNPSQTSQTVSVGIIGDTTQETTETFQVNLSNAGDGVITDGSATVTINDNDSVVCGTDPQITVEDFSITEGDAFTKNAAVTFSIPFNHSSGLSTRFYINTVNDTATAPSDFVAKANQLVVIASGDTTKTLTFKINGDTIEEGDESFLIELFNPTRGCIDPNDNTGTFTIIGDDGPPVPQISIADTATTETDAPSTVDVTLSLDIPSTDPITVQLDTVDGTATAVADYQAVAAQTVTFPASATTATFTLDIVGDTAFELTEEFQVALSAPSSNAQIDDGTATVTINDNDPNAVPDISIADVTVTEADVDVTATVTVSIDEVDDVPVTVQLDTSDGTATAPADYIAVSAATLTIPVGQLSVTQDITIKGDDLNEGGPETFTVTLSNNSGDSILVDPTATVTIDDDDFIPPVNAQLSVLDVSVEETNGTPPNDTRNVVITFELAPGTVNPSGQVRFMWETFDTGSATEGTDYPFARSVDPNDPNTDLPVVIPAPTIGGAPTTRTRSIQIYGDNLPEPDETFEVRLFDVTTNVDVAKSAGVVTIEDNDGPPEISIDDVSVDESLATATLTLSLDRAIGNQIDVQVDTADGTATAGADYTALVAQLVSFPANTQTVTVDVPILPDTDFEGDEDFTVNLSNPVNAAIVDNQATVTINDDETTPQMSIADVSAVEGDATFKSVLLNITLDSSSTQPITVRFGTVNGTAVGGVETDVPRPDFQRVNGSPTSGPLLTFNPGETTKTVSVKIFGDTEDELDEEFTVQLYAPTNATFLDDSATVTIIDNDTTPSISIDDLIVLEGDGNTPADFVLADATLNLDIASTDPITVDVDSADGTAVAGTDYEAITAQTVTFPANITTQTIQVKVFSNDVLDGNRDFVLDLTNPTNAVIADNQATITIDDNDDLPKVSVADLSVTEGDGSAPNDFVNADVTVTLDSPSATAATVQFDTSAGSATAGTDYEEVTAQTVTIPAGATSVTQTVKVFGDNVVEPDEDFTVTLSNQSANVDPGTMTATVTIVDNEVVPDVSIGDVTVTEGDTSFGFAVAVVTLSEVSNLAIDVDVDSTDGSATAGVDYELVDQTITIPAGSTTAQVFVKVFGDFDVEPTEDLTLTLSNPVNVNIADGTATVTINDQDTAPQISIADGTVVEGDAGTTTLDLTLTTDFPVPQTVTVDVATADGTATAALDYQPLSGVTATFTTGTDTTTVTVTVIGDTDFESNETFSVNLSNPVGAAIADGSATVTIDEDDVDPSKPNIRVEDIFVTEGDANQSNVELVFILEQASDNTIRATATMEDITTTAGAGPGDGDYVPIIDLPLVFSPGERILKRVIKINGDTDFEGNETARIILTPNTTPTLADDANLVDPEGILTILDSEVGPGDGPQIFIADVTQQEGGNIGFNNVEVTFVLDEPSGAQVLFDVAAADGNTGINDATLAGGDFQDPTTHLVMPFVFAPGEQIVKKNFRVNGDTLLEGNEVFRLLVQNVQGGVIGDGEGIVTILDTDLPIGTPTVNVIDIIDGENGDTSNEIATVKFFLDRPHDQTVTVDWQVADGTLTAAGNDYDQPDNTEVVFLPGEQIAERNFRINRDNVYTGSQFARAQISNPTGGAIIGDGEGIVTIFDDEQDANLPGIYFTTTDIEEADAGFTIANLKGYIDRPFSGVVTATFGFIDGTAKEGIDYGRHKSATNADITTIRWSNGEQVSETKARIFSDNFYEGNETFQMELLSVTGDAQIIDAIGDIIILDNEDPSDPPEPSFDDADIAVAASANVATANGGDTVIYTVDVTNNGPDEASVVEGTLALPTGLTLDSVGGCANATGTTCNIGLLANGATSSFTVSATVDNLTSGVVTATATASTDDIDSPSSNNTATVDVTTVSPYDNDTVYVSSTSNGTVGGVAFNDEDILAYDRSTDQWSLFFDGSDVGIITLDAFNITDFTPGATVIEFSMLSQRSLAGIGILAPADVGRFTGTTGANTSGTFEVVIDGSDIALASSAENIDALASSGVDDFAISSVSNLTANGFVSKEQDLVLFDPTSTGTTTSGSLSLLFDGSIAGLTVAAEDLNGAYIDGSGTYATFFGNINTSSGFTADFDDIVILTNPATGAFDRYFDGDLVGFGNENIDGIHIQRP